ncbi:hypothetical protein [Nodularia chucula]|uniref:hypothetical protein n=1 Tax=Nodularia chucula TaxID=3093667 RepID=UPI0039C6810C
MRENLGIVSGGVMPIQGVCVVGVGKICYPCTRYLCRDIIMSIQGIYEEVQR